MAARRESELKKELPKPLTTGIVDPEVQFRPNWWRWTDRAVRPVLVSAVPSVASFLFGNPGSLYRI